MALVQVETVNHSGQVVNLTLDEHGEPLAYLRKLVRRDELISVEIITPEAAPRKRSIR